MSYERPELFVLSGASTSVRTGVDNDTVGNYDAKISFCREGSFRPGDGALTSSTTGAYEADE